MNTHSIIKIAIFLCAFPAAAGVYFQSKMNTPTAIFLGDSLTEGFGLANPATERWPARLSAAMSWTEVNLAVGGRQVAEQGQTEELLGAAITSESITCVLTGTNDLRTNGADAARLASYREALLWVLATAATPTADWVEHGQFTATSGSWSTGSLLNGLSFSNSAGSYREYTVTGSTILYLGARAIGAGDYTISVDGQQVVSGTAEMPAATVAGRTYQGGGHLITGLTEGPHTVRITASGGGGALYTYIGRFVGLSGPAAERPLVLCGGVPEIRSDVFSQFPPFDQATEADRVAYSDTIRVLCEDLNAAGLDVRYVAASIDPVAQTTDGIHFNASGAQQIADQYEAVLTGSSPPPPPPPPLTSSPTVATGLAAEVFVPGFANSATQPAGEVN